MLGDAQYHWGWGPEVGVPEREVVRSFDRAIALDSAFTPAYIHAIEMAFRYGTPNGRRYLAAYLAQNPTDVDAEGMRLVSRLADPAQAQTAETQAILDTASVPQLQHAAAAMFEWGDSSEAILRVVRAMTASRHASDPAADTMQLRRRLVHALEARGHALEAIKMHATNANLAQLAMMGAAPIAMADSVLSRDMLANRTCAPCVASLWGAVGDTLRLQHMIHMADSVTKSPHPPPGVGAAPFLVALANAYITLARHDTTRALDAFASLPDSLCHACGFGWLTQAQLLTARGRYAEAAALLDETGVFNDPLGTLVELDRGRVAEKLGDKPRARDAYAFVADIWQHGDPVFQQYVAEARAGLKRLSGESGETEIPIRKP
jgi:hypothetical protein